MIRNQSFLETGLTPILASYGLAGTQGKIIHCKPYSGSDNGDGGKKAPVKSLAAAKALATANQNDVVLMYYENNTSASTTDYQASALDWSKDGVHLIGVGAGPMLGQRSRIAQKSTALTVGDLLTVSANNCIIGGIEIFQGVASAVPTQTYTRALVVSGQRNKIINCQISGIGDLSMDTASSCSLAVTGHENQFKDCYIGLDTVLRTTSSSEIYISAATRTIFDDCIVMSYTANTSFKAITLPASSAHTATFIRNTALCASLNRTGVAVPTGAILHSASGGVYMLGSGVFVYANVSTVTNANILLLSYAGVPTHASYPGIGVGVQTT